MMTMMMIPNS